MRYILYYTKNFRSILKFLLYDWCCDIHKTFSRYWLDVMRIKLASLVHCPKYACAIGENWSRDFALCWQKLITAMSIFYYSMIKSAVMKLAEFSIIVLFICWPHIEHEIVIIALSFASCTNCVASTSVYL